MDIGSNGCSLSFHALTDIRLPTPVVAAEELVAVTINAFPGIFPPPQNPLRLQLTFPAGAVLFGEALDLRRCYVVDGPTAGSDVTATTLTPSTGGNGELIYTISRNHVDAATLAYSLRVSSASSDPMTRSLRLLCTVPRPTAAPAAAAAARAPPLSFSAALLEQRPSLGDTGNVLLTQWATIGLTSACAAATRAAPSVFASASYGMITRNTRVPAAGGDPGHLVATITLASVQVSGRLALQLFTETGLLLGLDTDTVDYSGCFATTSGGVVVLSDAAAGAATDLFILADAAALVGQPLTLSCPIDPLAEHRRPGRAQFSVNFYDCGTALCSKASRQLMSTVPLALNPPAVTGTMNMARFSSGFKRITKLAMASSAFDISFLLDSTVSLPQSTLKSVKIVLTNVYVYNILLNPTCRLSSTADNSYVYGSMSYSSSIWTGTWTGLSFSTEAAYFPFVLRCTGTKSSSTARVAELTATDSAGVVYAADISGTGTIDGESDDSRMFVVRPDATAGQTGLVMLFRDGGIETLTFYLPSIWNMTNLQCYFYSGPDLLGSLINLLTLLGNTFTSASRSSWETCILACKVSVPLVVDPLNDPLRVPLKITGLLGTETYIWPINSAYWPLDELAVFPHVVPTTSASAPAGTEAVALQLNSLYPKGHIGTALTVVVDLAAWAGHALVTADTTAKMWCLTSATGFAVTSLSAVTGTTVAGTTATITATIPSALACMYVAYQIGPFARSTTTPASHKLAYSMRMTASSELTVTYTGLGQDRLVTVSPASDARSAALTAKITADYPYAADGLLMAARTTTAFTATLAPVAFTVANAAAVLPVSLTVTLPDVFAAAAVSDCTLAVTTAAATPVTVSAGSVTASISAAHVLTVAGSMPANTPLGCEERSCSVSFSCPTLPLPAAHVPTGFTAVLSFAPVATGAVTTTGAAALPAFLSRRFRGLIAESALSTYRTNGAALATAYPYVFTTLALSAFVFAPALPDGTVDTTGLTLSGATVTVDAAATALITNAVAATTVALNTASPAFSTAATPHFRGGVRTLTVALAPGDVANEFAHADWAFPAASASAPCSSLWTTTPRALTDAYSSVYDPVGALTAGLVLHGIDADFRCIAADGLSISTATARCLAGTWSHSCTGAAAACDLERFLPTYVPSGPVALAHTAAVITAAVEAAPQLLPNSRVVPVGASMPLPCLPGGGAVGAPNSDASLTCTAGHTWNVAPCVGVCAPIGGALDSAVTASDAAAHLTLKESIGDAVTFTCTAAGMIPTLASITCTENVATGLAAWSNTSTVLCGCDPAAAGALAVPVTPLDYYAPDNGVPTDFQCAATSQTLEAGSVSSNQCTASGWSASSQCINVDCPPITLSLPEASATYSTVVTGDGGYALATTASESCPVWRGLRGGAVEPVAECVSVAAGVDWDWLSQPRGNDVCASVCFVDKTFNYAAANLANFAVVSGPALETTAGGEMVVKDTSVIQYDCVDPALYVQRTSSVAGSLTLTCAVTTSDVTLRPPAASSCRRKSCEIGFALSAFTLGTCTASTAPALLDEKSANAVPSGTTVTCTCFDPALMTAFSSTAVDLASSSHATECDGEESWTNSAPATHCRYKLCPALTQYDGIAMDFNPGVAYDAGNAAHNALGSLVAMSCADGWVPNPAAPTLTSVTCTASAGWTGLADVSAASCVRKCDVTAVSDASYFLVNAYSADATVAVTGTKAYYDCANGFTHVFGDAMLTCQADGTWAGTPPVCSGLCDESLLQSSVGASYTLSGLTGSFFAAGAVATFTCNSDSLVAGNLVRTCSSLGVWSGNNPVCGVACDAVAFAAGAVGVTSNVRITPSLVDNSAITNSVIRFTCATGTTLVGGALTATCDATGNWVGTAPECRIVCNTDTLISTARRVIAPIYAGLTAGTGFAVDGATATFACVAYASPAAGATLTRECLSGVWNGQAAVCEYDTCTEPTPPTNTLAEFELTNNGRGDLGVGATATFACDTDYYVFNGPATVRCQSDLTWTAANFTCEKACLPRSVDGDTAQTVTCDDYDATTVSVLSSGANPSSVAVYPLGTALSCGCVTAGHTFDDPLESYFTCLDDDSVGPALWVLPSSSDSNTGSCYGSCTVADFVALYPGTEPLITPADPAIPRTTDLEITCAPGYEPADAGIDTGIATCTLSSGFQPSWVPAADYALSCVALNCVTPPTGLQFASAAPVGGYAIGTSASMLCGSGSYPALPNAADAQTEYECVADSVTQLPTWQLVSGNTALPCALPCADFATLGADVTQGSVVYSDDGFTRIGSTAAVTCTATHPLNVALSPTGGVATCVANATDAAAAPYWDWFSGSLTAADAVLCLADCGPFTPRNPLLSTITYSGDGSVTTAGVVATLTCSNGSDFPIGGIVTATCGAVDAQWSTSSLGCFNADCGAPDTATLLDVNASPTVTLAVTPLQGAEFSYGNTYSAVCKAGFYSSLSADGSQRIVCAYDDASATAVWQKVTAGDSLLCAAATCATAAVTVGNSTEQHNYLGDTTAPAGRLASVGATWTVGCAATTHSVYVGGVAVDAGNLPLRYTCDHTDPASSSGAWRFTAQDGTFAGAALTGAEVATSFTCAASPSCGEFTLPHGDSATYSAPINAVLGGYLVGTTVTSVTCSAGYSLYVGATLPQCGSDGIWSAPAAVYCTPVPAVTVARFTPQGRVVEVIFSTSIVAPTPTASTASTQNCAAVVAADDLLTHIGTDAVCMWSSATRFVITLPTSHLLRISVAGLYTAGADEYSNVINFKSAAIIPALDTAEYPLAVVTAQLTPMQTSSALLTAPATPPVRTAVEARLTAPAQVGACADVVLDASASFARFGNILAYSFTLIPATGHESAANAFAVLMNSLAAVNTTQAFTSLLSPAPHARVRIPRANVANVLPVSAEPHRVRVTATDWLGRTATAETLVLSVSAAPVITVLSGVFDAALGVRVVSTRRSAATGVQATVSPSGCAAADAAVAVTSLWSLVSTEPAALASPLSNATITAQWLTLPARTLATSSRYVLRLTATERVDGGATATATADVTLSVVATPLLAQISTSKYRVGSGAAVGQAVYATTNTATPANAAANIPVTALATVAGGTATTLPSLALYSALSNDPDSDAVITGSTDVTTDGLSFSWSCAAVKHTDLVATTTTGCGTAITSAMTTATSAADGLLHIPAPDLASFAATVDSAETSSLLFTLTVTAPSDPLGSARTSSVCARVDILSAQAFAAFPTVASAVADVSVERDAITSTVTTVHVVRDPTRSPLRLHASVTSPTQHYALLWTCESQSALDIFASGVLLSALTGPSLSLKLPATIPAGTRLVFRLSVFGDTAGVAPDALPPADLLDTAYLSTRTPGPLPGETSSRVLVVETERGPSGGACTQLTLADVGDDESLLESIAEGLTLVRCVGYEPENVDGAPLRYRWMFDTISGPAVLPSQMLLAAIDVTHTVSLAVYNTTTSLSVEIVDLFGASSLITVPITVQGASLTAQQYLALATRAASRGNGPACVQYFIAFSHAARAEASASAGPGADSAGVNDVTLMADAFSALVSDSVKNAMVATENEDRAANALLGHADRAVVADAVAKQVRNPVVYSVGSENIILLAAMMIDYLPTELYSLAFGQGFAHLSSFVDARLGVMSASVAAAVHLAAANSQRAAAVLTKTSPADAASSREGAVAASALYGVMPSEDPVTVASGALAYTATRVATDLSSFFTLTPQVSAVSGTNDAKGENVVGFNTLSTRPDAVFFDLKARRTAGLRSATFTWSARTTSSSSVIPNAMAHHTVEWGVQSTDDATLPQFYLPRSVLQSHFAAGLEAIDAVSVTLSDSATDGATSLFGADSLVVTDTQFMDNTTSLLGYHPSGAAGLSLFSDASPLSVALATPVVSTNSSGVSTNATFSPETDVESTDLVFIHLPHSTTPVNYTTVCQFYDPEKKAWSGVGCGVHAVTALSTVCKCNHLTLFSIRFSPKYFAPSFTKLDSDSFTKITWSELSRYPAPVIALSTWIAVTVICVLLANIIDRKFDEKGIRKLLKGWHPSSQALLTREDEYQIPADASTFRFIMRRYFVAQRRDHNWLSIFFRPTTDNFDSQARTYIAFLDILIALATAAIFFSDQNPEALYVVSGICAVAMFFVGSLMNYIFDSATNDRLKRFIYFYAEHVAFFHATGRSGFISRCDWRSIAAEKSPGLDEFIPLISQIALWDCAAVVTTTPEGTHQSSSNHTAGNEIATAQSSTLQLPESTSGTGSTANTAATSVLHPRMLSMLGYPTWGVPPTYTEPSCVERDEAVLRLLLRTHVALSPDLVVAQYHRRTTAQRFPRGWRLVGIILAVFITMGAILVTFLMGMEISRLDSSAIRDWLIATLLSCLLDALVTGPVLAFVRSCCIFFAKLLLLDRCKNKSTRYLAMPKLQSSRRFSIVENAKISEYFTSSKPTLTIQKDVCFDNTSQASPETRRRYLEPTPVQPGRSLVSPLAGRVVSAAPRERELDRTDRPDRDQRVDRREKTEGATLTVSRGTPMRRLMRSAPASSLNLFATQPSRHAGDSTEGSTLSHQPDPLEKQRKNRRSVLASDDCILELPTFSPLLGPVSLTTTTGHGTALASSSPSVDDSPTLIPARAVTPPPSQLAASTPPPAAVLVPRSFSNLTQLAKREMSSDSIDNRTTEARLQAFRSRVPPPILIPHVRDPLASNGDGGSLSASVVGSAVAASTIGGDGAAVCVDPSPSTSNTQFAGFGFSVAAPGSESGSGSCYGSMYAPIALVHSSSSHSHEAHTHLIETAYDQLSHYPAPVATTHAQTNAALVNSTPSPSQPNNSSTRPVGVSNRYLTDAVTVQPRVFFQDYADIPTHADSHDDDGDDGDGDGHTLAPGLCHTSSSTQFLHSADGAAARVGASWDTHEESADVEHVQFHVDYEHDDGDDNGCNGSAGDETYRF